MHQLKISLFPTDCQPRCQSRVNQGVNWVSIESINWGYQSTLNHRRHNILERTVRASKRNDILSLLRPWSNNKICRSWTYYANHGVDDIVQDNMKSKCFFVVFILSLTLLTIIYSLTRSLLRPSKFYVHVHIIEC